MRRSTGAGMQRTGGFTFVEVLLVTIVLGLLAALAIPSFLGTRDQATGATAEALLRTGASAVETASVDHEGYAALTTDALEAAEPAVSRSTSAGASARDDAITITGLGPDGYTLSTVSESGVTYVLEKDLTTSPAVTRTCGTGCTW
ncbi:MAG: type II secretion system protein [Thermoleophilia bacterium]